MLTLIVAARAFLVSDFWGLTRVSDVQGETTGICALAASYNLHYLYICMFLPQEFKKRQVIIGGSMAGRVRIRFAQKEKAMKKARTLLFQAG